MRQVHDHSRYGSFSAEAQRNLIAIGLDKAEARGYEQGRLEQAWLLASRALTQVLGHKPWQNSSDCVDI